MFNRFSSWRGRACRSRVPLPPSLASGAPAPRVQHQLIAELELLQQHVEALDAEIAQVIAYSRDGQILISIPGIGPTQAATILAMIGNIANFDRPARLKAYCGWAPTLTQSGALACPPACSLSVWSLSAPAPDASAHELVQHDWQVAHADSRRVINGVGDGGGRADDAQFPNSLRA
jgi:hypothetical protein